jgi:DNA-binding IclR family transcriptional regulator
VAKNGNNGNGNSSRQVPNLERALVILEFLVRHPRGFTLSELAKELEYPKNSVFRIMNTLLNYGYVNRDAGSLQYTLSRKLFSMAYGSVHESNLMENSMDVMRELRDEVGETVVISVMEGGEGLVLEQVQGLHPFRFICDPGVRQIPHTSASCKAIIAFMPDAERDRQLAPMRFKKFTATTITSRAAFLDELDQVRSLGYAVDRGEYQDGVNCVAGAILGPHGNSIAAITVTGPSNRMPESEFNRIGSLVAEYTGRISTRFGYGLQTNNLEIKHETA